MFKTRAVITPNMLLDKGVPESEINSFLDLFGCNVAITEEFCLKNAHVFKWESLSVLLPESEEYHRDMRFVYLGYMRAFSSAYDEYMKRRAYAKIKERCIGGLKYAIYLIKKLFNKTADKPEMPSKRDTPEMIMLKKAILLAKQIRNETSAVIWARAFISASK